MTDTPHSPLDRSSRVVLHELIVRREDEHLIVGRVTTDAFVALPVVAQRALELLTTQASIGDAETMLQAEIHEQVDLVDFARSLADLGFVRSIDGRPLDDQAGPSPSLPWLRAAHCRWMFTVPIRLAIALLAAAAAMTVLADRTLLPRPDDFFWTERTSVVLGVNAAIMLVTLALHEFAHLAAARSLDVGGRISLGTRLHLLVVQTDVTGLWAVARHRRYRVYLAGMSTDVVLLSLVVLARGRLALPGELEALLGAVALLLALGLVTQFQLYMRTDMYFVLADLLRTKNLMADSVTYLLSLAGRLLPAARRPQDVLGALSPRERRNVRLYAPVMAAGTLVALVAYVTYGAPIIISLYGHALGSLRTGIASGSVPQLLDGALALVIQGTFQVLFVWALVRNRGARTRAVLARLRAATA